jgi:hypothetical protein
MREKPTNTPITLINTLLLPQMLDLFQGIFDLLITKIAPVFSYQL